MVATRLKRRVSEAFNSSAIEKNRYLWIDYLRGIIIILVVYHHAFLGMAQNGISVPQSIKDANLAAYSFRMPLFFIFSGIFTALSLTSRSAKTIIWRKFNLLLYPYFIWSAIQITLQIFFSNYANSNRSFFDYVYILYQPKRLEQFWYLPALFNATAVFVLLKRRFKTRDRYHFLLGLFFFLLAPFLTSVSMMSNWMRFYIFLVIGDTLSHFILKKEVQEQLKKPLYFFAFIPVFLVAQLYYFNVIGVHSLENDSASLQSNQIIYLLQQLGFLLISLVGCTTLILLSFLLEKWNPSKWLRIIGFHSLYIYIMHVIVVGFVRSLFIRYLHLSDYIIVLPAAIILGVIVPIIFYNLIGKKYLWFLFYIRRTKKETVRFKESNIKPPEILLPRISSGINNI